MLYKFRYKITYPWSTRPDREDVYAESRIEADGEIAQRVAKRKISSAEFVCMTESGPALEDIVAGEKCLIQAHGVLNETVVSRTTAKFIYVEMYPHVRFRRDGSEIDRWGKRNLYRYDKRQYQDYWKGRADRERLNNIKRVDWLNVPEELFDEIYAKLEAIEMVPHVDDLPLRLMPKVGG